MISSESLKGKVKHIVSNTSKNVSNNNIIAT